MPTSDADSTPDTDHPPGADHTSDNADGTPPVLLRKSADWILSILLVVVGLGAGAVGLAVRGAANRDRISELVADETIQSDVLTEAELVDALYNLAWWGGLGLAVTGGLIAVVGVAYLAYRSRVRDRPHGSPDTLSVGVIGAVVTAVLSFIPFSPVVGGGVAGYLQRGDAGAGARVGAVAGLIATLPVAVLLGFLVAGFVASGAGFVAGIAAVALGVSALFAVALSALGGYLGVYLADEFGD